MTFKPTTELWSPGGGEPELEVLLILVNVLKGATVISHERYTATEVWQRTELAPDGQIKFNLTTGLIPQGQKLDASLLL